jgi:hypothetical protein
MVFVLAPFPALEVLRLICKWASAGYRLPCPRTGHGKTLTGSPSGVVQGAGVTTCRRQLNCACGIGIPPEAKCPGASYITSCSNKKKHVKRLPHPRASPNCSLTFSAKSGYPTIHHPISWAIRHADCNHSVDLETGQGGTEVCVVGAGRC